MSETQEKRKLQVSTVEGFSPFVRVPAPQLDQVKELLTSHGVDHWVERVSVSLDGRPAITVINFGRGADPAPIQSILDQAS